jgi:hypothetical protein
MKIFVSVVRFASRHQGVNCINTDLTTGQGSARKKRKIFGEKVFKLTMKNGRKILRFVKQVR